MKIYHHLSTGDRVIVGSDEREMENEGFQKVNEIYYNLFDQRVRLARNRNGETGKGITLLDDAKCNFLTIEAVYKDLATDETLYLLSSEEDMIKGRLVPVNPISVTEVFRLASIYARSDEFICDIPKSEIPDTKECCKIYVGNFFMSIMSNPGINLRRYFDFLRKYDQIDYWFPEINDMNDCFLDPNLNIIDPSSAPDPNMDLNSIKTLYDIILDDLNRISIPSSPFFNQKGFYINRMYLLCRGLSQRYDLIEPDRILELFTRLGLGPKQLKLMKRMLIFEYTGTLMMQNPERGDELRSMYIPDESSNITISQHLIAILSHSEFCYSTNIGFPRIDIVLKLLKYTLDHNVLKRRS